MLKTLVSACVFAGLAITSTLAHAQTFDNRTLFTFSQPVALPGITLPAGTYLFRLADPMGDRRVVQILSEDGNRAYTTLLSIPAQRFEPPSEPEIRFMETAEGAPAAIKTWWYPGKTIGYEFIYPKEQALRLAKAASSSVLTTASGENDTTEGMKTADLARVGASGSESAVTVESQPAAATVAGTAQQGQIAASAIEVPASPAPIASAEHAAALPPSAEPRPAVSDAGPTRRTRLPQTASPTPAWLLAGLLTLGAGALLATWPHLRT